MKKPLIVAFIKTPITLDALSVGKLVNPNGDEMCMGVSRFCEWEKDNLKYQNVGVTAGACTSNCKSYCNNFGPFNTTNGAYPNGCFKCYGMYPGIFNETQNDPSWIHSAYNGDNGYGDRGLFCGPCTEDNKFTCSANYPRPKCYNCTIT